MKRFKRVVSFIVLSLTFVFVISLNAFAQKNDKFDNEIEQSDKPMAKAKWTYLIYFAANNNLGQYMFDNLNEVEETGSTSNVNFVCEAKLQKGSKRKNSFLVDKQGKDVAVRWRLVQDKNPQSLNFESDPRHQTYPYKSTKSASKTEFESFIKWAIKSYPAERYGLVLNSHGSGWQGMMEDVSFPQDNINGSEFAQVIKNSGIKLEVINFDSCLMGTIENAYDVRNVAKYFIGSQANVPGTGDDYRAIAKFLTNNPNANGLQLASLTVNAFIAKHNMSKSSSTQSAFDLGKVDKFINCFAELNRVIALNKFSAIELKKRAADTQHFDTNGDLMQFLEGLELVNDKSIANAASKCVFSLKEALLVVDFSSGSGEYVFDTRMYNNGLSIRSDRKVFTGDADGFMPVFQTFENKDIDWSDAGNLQLSRGINIFLPVMTRFLMNEYYNKNSISSYCKTDFSKATGWGNTISSYAAKSQLQADALTDLELICSWTSSSSNADVDLCVLEPIPFSSKYSGTISPFSSNGCTYGEFSKDNQGLEGHGEEWFRFDSGPINSDFQIFAVGQTKTNINITLQKKNPNNEGNNILYQTITNKDKDFGYGPGAVYLGRVRWNGFNWAFAAPGRTGQWQNLDRVPLKNGDGYAKNEELKTITTPKHDINIYLDNIQFIQKLISILI